jgi:hypothetical protein
MANISYTPTFHHQPWRDRLSRVEATGPNGVNGRFTAIENDLKQVSAVVAQIASALDQIERGPQQVLAFTPQLKPVRSGPGWGVNSNGAPQATLDATTLGVQGLIDLDLPHGASITSLRVRGQFTGTANAGGTIALTIALNRVSLTPGVPSSLIDPIVTTGVTDHQRIGPLDITGPADPADATKAQVDRNNYRYLVSIGAQATQPDGFIVTVNTLEIAYHA